MEASIIDPFSCCGEDVLPRTVGGDPYEGTWWECSRCGRTYFWMMRMWVADGVAAPEQVQGVDADGSAC